MNTLNTITTATVHHSPILCGLAMACVSALASDRPQAPTSVTVTAASPVQATVRFFQTPVRPRDLIHLVNWEVEQFINGLRTPHHEEAKLSAAVNANATASQHAGGPVEFAVSGLAPQTEYCFRIWTRLQTRSGLRSDNPSDKACAVTPPYPPLAPLDAKAQLRAIGDRVPTVSWSAPDMSGWRGIDGYTIERQSPPGQNRPWIPEKTVSGGPNGSRQSATFGLAHTITTSAIDPQQTHVYRICAVNKGGKTCAEPVSLEKLAPGPQQAQQSSTAARVAAAATPSVAGPLRAPSTRTTTAQTLQATPTPPAGSGTGTVSAALRLQAALAQSKQQPAASAPSGVPGAEVPYPRVIEPQPNSVVQSFLRVRAEPSVPVGLPQTAVVVVSFIAPSPSSGASPAMLAQLPTPIKERVGTADLARGIGFPMPLVPEAAGQWRLEAHYETSGLIKTSVPLTFEWVPPPPMKEEQAAAAGAAGQMQRQSLNPQPLPPKASVRASAQLDQRALNPQPLPPKDRKKAAAFERQGLNPQPLPPRDVTAPASTFQR